MKPIIIICGAPHSFTSMVSKFLIDNGGYCPDPWDNPKYDLPYSRFESKEIQEYLMKKHRFKDKDLTEFFKSLPEDQVVTLKAPLLIYYINDVKKFTDRPIKVVFVNRNPQDIIMSSIEKSGKGFIYYFERIVWIYNFIIDSKLPIHMLVSERLLGRDESTAKSLLEYCELSSKEVNFKSIDVRKTKQRNPSYLKYRFANFFWKRLSIFFRVYNFKVKNDN